MSLVRRSFDIVFSALKSRTNDEDLASRFFAVHADDEYPAQHQRRPRDLQPRHAFVQKQIRHVDRADRAYRAYQRRAAGADAADGVGQ